MARVLILNNAIFYPNSSRVALVREMVRYGHNVTVALPFSGLTEDQIRVRVGISEVRYIDLNFQRAGVNPLVDLLVLLRLSRLFRTHQPEKILACTHKPVVYGAIVARWLGFEDFYGWNTGLGYSFTGEALVRKALRAITCALYRIALPGMRVIFFQNEDDRDLLLGLVNQPHTRAIVLNGSGVDTDFFCPPNHPPPANPAVFLMISRLLWEKGVGEFVEAAQRLKQQFPRARFCLLGGSYSCRDSVPVRLVERWRSQQVVEFLGEAEDVRPFIARASVVVLPSYREGMPRAILEAMAMGRAVITSDVPGCRQTVVGGRNGILVPPRDSAALAEACRMFLENPHLIGEFGEQGRIIAEQRFSMRRVNATVLGSLKLSKARA